MTTLAEIIGTFIGAVIGGLIVFTFLLWFFS